MNEYKNEAEKIYLRAMKLIGSKNRMWNIKFKEIANIAKEIYRGKYDDYNESINTRQDNERI